LGVLSLFPTAGRVADWIGEQQRLVDDQKKLSA